MADIVLEIEIEASFLSVFIWSSKLKSQNVGS